MRKGTQCHRRCCTVEECRSLALFIHRADFDILLLELSIRPDLIHRLVPRHAEAELASRGLDVNNFTPLSPESLRVSLD